VLSKEVAELLGSKVQVICPFPEEVTLQSVPSIETELFLGLGENPFPLIVMYCPPMLPVAGVTEVIEGSAVN
jgi:hypothetical protein